MLSTSRPRLGILAAFVVGALPIAALAQETPTPEEVAIEAGRMADAYRATVKTMRDDLKDASSARFKEVYIRSSVGQDGKMHHGVCGYANAKNSYGGYTGWKRFYGNETMLIFEGDRMRLDPGALCEGPNGRSWTDSDFAVQMTRDVTAP